MRMKVWTDKDKAVVSCTFLEKEIVKAIGDYKFDKKSKTWLFPLKKLVEIVENLNIVYDDDTKAIYNELRKAREGLHKKINLANKIKDKKTEPVGLASLYYHQRQAVSLGFMFNSYAYFMETGTGKTLVAITLMQYVVEKFREERGESGRCLVVAPLSILKSVWGKEITKWCSDLTFTNLWRNIDALKLKESDVYIINYEQFKKLIKQYNLADYIDCIIIDESSKLKNPKSAITKAFLTCRDIMYRYCLTGTPAPNNLLEYWGQLSFVNDEILGSSFYKYRATYFYSSGYGGYQFFPMKNAKDAIMAQVSKQAFSIRKQDCLDLPDRVYEVRLIDMDDIQQTAYDEMKRENVLEFKGHTVLSANELAKMMKLRQVTSGFIINNASVPLLISESKINALKDLLDEIPEDEQIIIWCQFHFEIERLHNEFKNDSLTLFGAMAQTDKEQSIQDFLDKKKRILIGHPKTGGMGLNFQHNSSYMVWYSLSYSQEEYSQACDRIYRSGQKNKCTYYILAARNSIDEIIYKALDKKASLMNYCLEALKKGDL